MKKILSDTEISTPTSYNLKTDNLEMMEVIAKNDQSLNDIKNLTSSKVTDQLKVFLISQARNELIRVVRLTRFLDKLEEKFMDKVDQKMINDELTLKQYNDVISTITGLLSRSNTIISQVLKDESLMTILNTTIYSSGAGSVSSTVVSSLKDSRSRERVRAVIGQIMYSIDQEYPNNNEIVVQGGHEGE